MQASSYRKPRKIELTDEQRAKTEARKARFRELVKHIASLDDSARVELASRMPVVSVEGRGLSVHNQCLIAMQYPSATVVGGFAQWLKHGRAVRKGQSGMMIWVPIDPEGEAAIVIEDGDGLELCHVMGVDAIAQANAALIAAAPDLLEACERLWRHCTGYDAGLDESRKFAEAKWLAVDAITRARGSAVKP